MPGGVALFDYNNDGLFDIFLVNGGRVNSSMAMPESFDRKNPRILEPALSAEHAMAASRT